MPTLPFEFTYADLPGGFSAPVTPARAPRPALVRINEPLARLLGLDPAWLGSPEGVAMLSGARLPPELRPVAMAYSGHQFGGWAGQLGDGRAVLLGELIGGDGVRRDVHLKGAGRTPFSRGGDGKAALGPVIREYVVSEAMAALGVPTTRALAAVRTGETVFRETGALPGAVLARVAQSHVRVGTFEHFHARGDPEGVRTLVDYVVRRHFPALDPGDAAGLLAEVVDRQVDLVARWMSLGFVHGVMNTDNMQIVGETIDYGPCAFLDTFAHGKVFSSIDHNGRYAWGNQPQVAWWNLARLAECLLGSVHRDLETAVAVVEPILAGFGPEVVRAIDALFAEKLGLPDGEATRRFTTSTLEVLEAQAVDFTLFFRRLTQVARGGSEAGVLALFADPEAGRAWMASWRAQLTGMPRVEAMAARNPVRIPRNHRVEQAIAAAYAGDQGPFERLVDALARPYEDLPEYADLEEPPAASEVVCRTFCGT